MTTTSSPLIENLNTRLSSAAATHRVPGASIALYAGETLHEAACGVVNVDTGVAVSQTVWKRHGKDSREWRRNGTTGPDVQGLRPNPTGLIGIRYGNIKVSGLEIAGKCLH